MKNLIKMAIVASALFAAKPAMAFLPPIHCDQDFQVLYNSCGFTWTAAQRMKWYGDYPDYYATSNSANHFDNCNFTGGQNVINSSLDSAVSNARIYQMSNNTYYRDRAYEYMGYAFHAAQDFYSHSTWSSNYRLGLGTASKPSGWQSGTYSNSPDLCTVDRKPHGAQYAPNDGTTRHKDHNLRTGYQAAWNAANSEVWNQWNRMVSKIYATYGTTTGNAIIAKLRNG